MLEGRRILAVVPARSGSKGIPDKNMRRIGGKSLIGHAGDVLSRVGVLDARVISTDSEAYAAEGRAHGLDAPFLRPDRLSGDDAGAVETLQHAVEACEDHFGGRFDVVLIIEPTSPMRTPQDVERGIRLLVETGADSVVTVSPASNKFHPLKLLTVANGRIGFHREEGRRVTNRQEIDGTLYWRNGICYALSRSCLMERGAVFTDNTVADVIHRPVVNIDDPLELAWAEFLMSRNGGAV